MGTKSTVGLTHIRVGLNEGCYVGPGRADLLEAISELHSIASAGRRMGMSYNKAWGLVQALNEGFGAPLVETTRGGRGQGGAALTALGKSVLAHYRAIQRLAGEAADKEIKALAALVKT